MCVDTAEGTYRFYMYKLNTFEDFINQGRKYNSMGGDVVEAEVVKATPLTDDELNKLSKLNELHKDGVLTDEQFEKEKNLILNR